MAVDADLIQKCADPTLKPAIVEKFLHAAGAPDPLAVMVRSGDRIILLPPVKTPEEALELARSHIGRAVVRVGITQYPAGLGVKESVGDVAGSVRRLQEHPRWHGPLRQGLADRLEMVWQSDRR